jgi:hypothetical protein
MFKNIIGLFALSSCLFLVACGGDGEGAAKTTAGTYTGTIIAKSGSDTLTGPVVMIVSSANSVTGTVTFGTPSGFALLIDLKGTVDASGKLTVTGTAGSPAKNVMSLAGNIDTAKGVMSGTYSVDLNSTVTGVFSLSK